MVDPAMGKERLQKRVQRMKKEKPNLGWRSKR